jgi:hypothetical protein
MDVAEKFAKMEQSFHDLFEKAVPEIPEGGKIKFRTTSGKSYYINRAAKDIYDPKLRKTVLLCAMQGGEYRKVDFGASGDINLTKGQEEIVRFLYLHPRCKNSPFADKKLPPLWELFDDSVVRKQVDRNNELEASVRRIVSRMSLADLTKVAQKFDKGIVKQQYSRTQMENEIMKQVNGTQAAFVLEYAEDKDEKAIAAIALKEQNNELVFSQSRWLSKDGRELVVVPENRNPDVYLIECYKNGTVKSTLLEDTFARIYEVDKK